jgi:tetratricopeptide (TPR) repeat protein
VLPFKALRQGVTLRKVGRSAAERKVAAPERRGGPALDAFEKAVKALGKKDFERARGFFEGLIENHPDERDLVERARAYRAICDRSLERRPAFRPKSFEDLLNYGVFLHNRGEYAEALRAFQQAAEIHPKNEHVLYCLAAAYARLGDAGGAVKALRSAIHANVANRTQARSDSDFDALRGDQEFVSLLHS